MHNSPWLLPIFLLLLPMLGAAQPESSAEQLQKQLLETGQDTNRVKLFLELGRYYLYKPGELSFDLDSSLVAILEAKSLTETLKDQKLKEESLSLLGFCYFEREEPKLGREAVNQLIESIQKSGDLAREAETWMSIAQSMYRSSKNYDIRIFCYQNAIPLYQKLGKNEPSIVALKEIADIHLNQGKLDEGEKELLQVIDQYKSIGFVNLHYTYDLLAAVSAVKGNFNQALFYALEMIKSMEATGDTASYSEFYIRLGRIYEQLGQIEKSIDSFKKAYPKSNLSKYSVCLSLSRGLIKLGRTTEALALINNLTQNQPPASAYDKTYVANIFALCYEDMKQYDLAEKYYLETIQFERQLNINNSYTSVVNYRMALFYINRDRYLAAEPYLKKVLSMPKGFVAVQVLKDTHLLLFKVDSSQGKYLSAIQHYQLHKQLNDSIVNVTKNRQIAELQIQYDTEKKEKDINLLQNESALQQSRLQEANLAKNITFGGGSLLLVILGLLYNRYRLKQRSNRQLELQQIEINQTNRSLQNLVNEKELLLREIHHRVKNNLQIVMSLLNTQSSYLENTAALSAIRDSQQRIHSISLIHKKLYQSNNIAQINMPIYVRELVDYLQDSYGTSQSVRFDLNIDPIDLDVTQAVPIGLILNEAISNAVKYAFPNNRAGLVAISMHHGEGNQFKLTISDNGTGLPPGFDPRESASLGMNLMRGLSKQLH